MTMGFIGAGAPGMMTDGGEPASRDRAGSRRFGPDDALRGQAQTQDRALAFAAFDVERPAVELREAARDRQAKTGTLGCCERTGAAAEGRPGHLDLVGCHARSI